MVYQKRQLPDNYEKVKGWLRSQAVREALAKAIPAGTNTDAWIEGALASVRGDEDVRAADPITTLGAIFEIAALGLRLEPSLGHAYIESRWNRDKGGHEASAQVQYRGLIQLAFQNPEVVDVEAMIVHQHDEFRFCKGTNQELYHTWDVSRSDRGPMRAVYSGLRFASGYYSFQTYSMDDILVSRQQILAQKGIHIEVRSDKSERYFKLDRDTGAEVPLASDRVARIPWIANLRPMAMKTAIRWSAKYWKLGHTFERAAQLVGIAEAGESQGLADRLAELLPANIARAIERGDAPLAIPEAPLPSVESPDVPQEGAAVPSARTGRLGARAIQQQASLKDRMAIEAASREVLKADPALDEK